jgi:hypothetical protein
MSGTELLLQYLLIFVFMGAEVLQILAAIITLNQEEVMAAILVVK